MNTKRPGRKVIYVSNKLLRQVKERSLAMGYPTLSDYVERLIVWDSQLKWLPSRPRATDPELERRIRHTARTEDLDTLERNLAARMEGAVSPHDLCAWAQALSAVVAVRSMRAQISLLLSDRKKKGEVET